LSTLENVILGSFDDIKRFVVGVTSQAPSTRIITEDRLNQARAALTSVGCDLSHCTVENLHTFPVDIEPTQLFPKLMKWQQWPRSGFFACLSSDKQGATWFSYRLWKLIPIVMMKLKINNPPHHIVYNIKQGIGKGGYHSFLINQVELPPVFEAYKEQTSLSIFTTFPPMRIMPFPEGLHDQVNYDIYHQLKETCVK